MKKQHYQKEAYLFILPIYILFAVYIVYPIFFNIYHSFFKWNGVSSEKTFIGTENYIRILKDPVLLILIKNFFIFGFLTIVLQAVFGIILANFLVHGLKFAGFYRTIYYIPVVATPVVIGNIFSKIFETNRGHLNVTLRALGLDFLAKQWLADPKIALYCIAAVNIWQWTGYSMLVYYANMLNIPEDLYESATIDGAGDFTTFFKITLPLCRNSHFSLFILGALGTLKCFDIPYVLTKGGPNYATEFFSTYIYKKSFDLWDQGGSSTLVVIMFVFALIITFAQLRVYYRGNSEKELSA